LVQNGTFSALTIMLTLTNTPNCCMPTHPISPLRLLHLGLMLLVLLWLPSPTAAHEPKSLSDPNTIQKLGPELFDAVQAGSLSQVQALIKKKADVNWRNPDLFNQTPIFPAAYGPHPEILRVLLKAGANVNAQDDDGETALHRAAHYGYVETAQVLLEFGADKNLKDKWGNTPLMSAQAQGNSDVVKLLGGTPAATTDPGRDRPSSASPGEALFSAVQGGLLSEVQALIKKKADVNWRNAGLFNQTPIFPAAYGPHPEILRALLQAGANVNAQDDDGETALHRAAYYGYTETAQILLEFGANPKLTDKWGKTPLQTAENQENTSVIKLLGGTSGTPANRGTQPSSASPGEQLFGAVQSGDLVRVKQLVANGAPLDWKNPEMFSQTPIFPAAYGPHPEILAFLLSKGANINAQDEDGETALHRAAHYGYSETVKVLLKNKANTKLKDKWGNTPYDTAVKRENTYVAKLIKKGK
jgi:ankyrin repeat protein